MTKEYFFESDFVKLSWEDVLAVWPNTKYVTVARRGDIARHESEPYVTEKYAEWNSRQPSGLIIFKDVASTFENWRELIFKAPQQVPVEIWQAIELLFGPDYKWITQDANGRTYVWNRVPDRQGSEWYPVSGGEFAHIDKLDDFFTDYTQSLTEKPELP